mmetsp:Transcript_74729/g.112639  ORF Transcript_74729/g.112639 Transcript_74729/m.112639 type:complete len:116 (-) Transcript_74729:380-727(-)
MNETWRNEAIPRVLKNYKQVISLLVDGQNAYKESNFYEIGVDVGDVLNLFLGKNDTLSKFMTNILTKNKALTQNSSDPSTEKAIMEFVQGFLVGAGVNEAIKHGEGCVDQLGPLE